MNIPFASYAPWASDSAFRDAYEVVKAHTLVDAYRCYGLWEAVGQVASLPGPVIEVGSWRGGTACLMAMRLALLKTPKTVLVCDTFSGVVKAGERDSFYRGGEHADTSEAVALELFVRAGAENCRLLKGVFPDETGGLVANERFAFAHIDVDVFESARSSFEFVWPRLQAGGMVIFDDYGFLSCPGVTDFVNGLKGTLAGAIVLYNLNGQAVVVKTA